MLSNPLISIVIPIYNKEFWVTETLNSVLNQSYKNWECIIINDGSTDQSLDIVLAFTEKHPANWMIETITNSGQSYARNLGIKLATGAYIAFLDADDLWHPDKLKSQIELFISNPALELVLSPYVIFRERQIAGFRLVRNRNPRKFVEDWLSMRGFGGLIESAGMVKRETLVNLGDFSNELSMAAGLDLCLRIVNSRPSSIASQPHVFYRLSDMQYHKNEDVLISDLAIVSDEHSNSREILDKLKVGHTNYLYWSHSRSFGRLEFLKRTLLAILAFDVPKLTMLYFLIGRNVIALYKGAFRHYQIQSFLRTHRIKG